MIRMRKSASSTWSRHAREAWTLGVTPKFSNCEFSTSNPKPSRNAVRLPTRASFKSSPGDDFEDSRFSHRRRGHDYAPCAAGDFLPIPPHQAALVTDCPARLLFRQVLERGPDEGEAHRALAWANSAMLRCALMGTRMIGGRGGVNRKKAVGLSACRQRCFTPFLRITSSRNMNSVQGPLLSRVLSSLHALESQIYGSSINWAGSVTIRSRRRRPICCGARDRRQTTSMGPSALKRRSISLPRRPNWLARGTSSITPMG